MSHIYEGLLVAGFLVFIIAFGLIAMGIVELRNHDDDGETSAPHLPEVKPMMPRHPVPRDQDAEMPRRRRRRQREE